MGVPKKFTEYLILQTPQPVPLLRSQPPPVQALGLHALGQILRPRCPPLQIVNGGRILRQMIPLLGRGEGLLLESQFPSGVVGRVHAPRVLVFCKHSRPDCTQTVLHHLNRRPLQHPGSPSPLRYRHGQRMRTHLPHPHLLSTSTPPARCKTTRRPTRPIPSSPAPPPPHPPSAPSLHTVL